MYAFLSFSGDVGILAWLPSLFSPQHPDRWCCLQWLGRTSFSERIWGCAWLCSKGLWVGCTERRSLWVLISVPPLTSQGHQASHFLSTFGLLHPPYGANDTIYIMGLSSGLMNVQGGQSLHTCDELRKVRPWTLRLLPIRGDLSLQEWAMFIVLVIFGHFTVCLISSTHAIISYIHDNALGSVQMKSSTSVFLGTSCVLGILCTRLQNLRKNQIMRRSKNVKYLWANSCLCFYCSLWWFICLNRGSSFCHITYLREAELQFPECLWKT